MKPETARRLALAAVLAALLLLAAALLRGVGAPWMVACAFMLALATGAWGWVRGYTAAPEPATQPVAEVPRRFTGHATDIGPLLDAAGIGWWEWDLAADQMHFNGRWYAMLGYAEGDFDPGLDTWQSLINPQDRDAMRDRLRACARGDVPLYEAEYRMQHASGAWVWVRDRGWVVQRDADGEPLRMQGTHVDPHAGRHLEDALRESEARFHSLTHFSSDWYWELDDQHRFTRFEGYSSLITGATQQENIGVTRWDLGALNMGEADWAAHRAVLDARQEFRDLELQRLDAAGGVYWVAISGAPIFDADGRFTGYRGVGRNITDRKRAEDEIERLAYYDALTGLPNRRLLLDRLAAAVEASRDTGRRGAILFIDLDNFKDLNDTLGHDVGDTLLERVANRLVTCVRAGDTVARLGGDEFVVVLERLSDALEEATQQASFVGNKVLDVLNHPYALEGYQHHSTPSLGIAVFDATVGSVDELLKRGDLAMYQAKAAGRNTLCFFHPDMQTAVSARSALEADLRQAVPQGELMLYLQPVVDVAGRMLGAEALLRWRQPERGMVSPADFIPLAEQTGLILPIGQWVLQTACEQLVEWAAEAATAGLTLAVNVSARQFRHPDFVPQLQELFARTGAVPQRLKLELTETLLLQDVEDTITKMQAIQQLGVGFSLDDFGTGYSSLAYLKRLPLDQLKIDQSFVRDVLTDPNDAAIVRTILALAQSLDLGVVAEGVETEGQRDFLVANGCPAFQGYLFGRPGPAASLPLPTVLSAA